MTATEEAAGLSGSMLPVALTSVKWPRTVIIPKCLVANSTCRWYGSICQLTAMLLPRVASFTAKNHACGLSLGGWFSGRWSPASRGYPGWVRAVVEGTTSRRKSPN